MTSRTSLVLTTVVLALCAIGFAWRSARSLRHADASLAVLTQNLARVDGDLRQTQAAIAAGEQAAAALRAKRQSLPVRAAVAANPPVAPTDSTTLMEANPRLRALFLKQWRANLAGEYGLLYQRLGLTPAQIERFEDLATEHQDDLITLQATALAQGFTAPVIWGTPTKSQLDAGIAGLVKQSDEKFYAIVANEIGADLGAALAQHATQKERLLGAEAAVYPIKTQIPVGSPPLTAVQAEQLTQLLANSSRSYQEGGAVNPNEIDWEGVSAQAATFLSESQAKVFQTRAGFAQIASKQKQFYAALAAAKAEPPPASPKTEDKATLSTQLAAANAELRLRMQRYSEEHPRMKEIRQTIASLEQQIANAK